MIKGDFFLPFTVGTPTTAAQPPFQSQYVSDYVFFTNMPCGVTSPLKCLICMRRACNRVFHVTFLFNVSMVCDAAHANGSRVTPQVSHITACASEASRRALFSSDSVRFMKFIVQLIFRFGPSIVLCSVLPSRGFGREHPQSLIHRPQLCRFSVKTVSMPARRLGCRERARRRRGARTGGGGRLLLSH